MWIKLCDDFTVIILNLKTTIKLPDICVNSTNAENENFVSGDTKKKKHIATQSLGIRLLYTRINITWKTSGSVLQKNN